MSKGKPVRVRPVRRGDSLSFDVVLPAYGAGVLVYEK
jgi:hypothetical protein